MGNTFSKPISEPSGASNSAQRQQTHNNANRSAPQYSTHTRQGTATSQHLRSQAFHDRSPSGRGGLHGQSRSSKKN